VDLSTACYVYLPVGKLRIRPQAAKRSIHLAATSLFAQQGYAATSTRQICQQAGITKPVLYYHFGSKERLYEELILDAFNQYREGLLEASTRGRTPADRLVAVIEAMFAFVRKDPALSRLAFRMIFAPEGEAPRVDHDELCKYDCRLIETIVVDAVRAGQVSGNSRDIADCLTGTAVLHIIDFLVAGKPKLTAALARRAVALLLPGPRTRKPLKV
jgi:TetR/AcrR family transcriptional regulator